MASCCLKYDDRYNEWDDYTFCLKRFVRLTHLFHLLDLTTKREAIRGLYNQLAMCGRELGDSWYTTDKVYEVWPQFNLEYWPLLEQEIRRHAGRSGGFIYPKQQAMLDYLKPGADYKSFLARGR